MSDAAFPECRGRGARPRSRVAPLTEAVLRVLPMVLVLPIVLGVPSVAEAHPLTPASLQITETQAGVAEARFQTAAGARLVPRWPEGCLVTPRSRRVERDVSVEMFELACAKPALAGMVVGVDGLDDRDAIAIVRVAFADGGVVRGVLGPAHPRFEIPAEVSWTRVAAEHGRLGIDHLLGGLDHVLFVLGMLLLVRGWRARVAALTAFTVGHSVTLGLAVLGVVRVPPAPVEIAIALTLLVVALRALEPATREARPWWFAGGFGLIHGLGFAGALSATGLPPGDIPLALASFNVGIELGQLALASAFVVVAAIAAMLLSTATRARLRVALAYAIGALAAMWVLERTWAALTS